MAVQAYAALTSERYGGRDGSACARRPDCSKLPSRRSMRPSAHRALVKAARSATALLQHQLLAEPGRSWARSSATRRGARPEPDLRGAIEAPARAHETWLCRRQCPGPQAPERRRGVAGAPIGDRDIDPGVAPRPDAWGRALSAKLAALPADDRARLTALLALAAKGGAGAKPAKGWLKTRHKPSISRTGRCSPSFCSRRSSARRRAFRSRPTTRTRFAGSSGWRRWRRPRSRRRARDLRADLPDVLPGAFRLPLSLVLGNASIHAFSLLPGFAGVGSPHAPPAAPEAAGRDQDRRRRRWRRSPRRAGDAWASSRRSACPTMASPSDGTLAIAVGPATAELTISEADALDVTWRGAGGQPLKRAAGRDQGEPRRRRSSSCKAQAKEIGDTLKAQRLRLERLYLDEREWPLRGLAARAIATRRLVAAAWRDG